MSPGSSKTRGKVSSKTPGRGQQTLSALLSKRNNVSDVSRGRVNSHDYNEPGKKRKLGQCYFGATDDEPKSKRISPAANDDANIANKSVQSSNRRQRAKYSANREATSIKKHEIEEILICDDMDLDVMEVMKSEEELVVKENSCNEQTIGRKNWSSQAECKRKSLPEALHASKVKQSEFSAKAKSKDSLPLKIVSQNVQFPAKGEEPLTRNKFEEDLLPDSEKGERILNREDSKEEEESKKITHAPVRAEKDCLGIDDDNDFLLKAFDKSFEAGDCPEKTGKESDSKSQSNSIALIDDFDDIFSDDWMGDIGVEVDLTNLQRCKVSHVDRDKFQNLIVNAVHVETQIPVAVTLMGFWKEARLQPGDFVNIQAAKQSNGWIVDNNSGFVVEQPDFLVSGTSVVGALFCQRRGVLSDRFKGIESVADCKQGSSVMVIGSLAHELLQEVLKKKIYTKPGITKLLKDILRSQNTANMLYSAGMSTETCQKEMSPFVPKIFHFIERYVKDTKAYATDENFKGKINVVRDIEENLWVPQFGIKGKVDVTVEVNVNLKPRIMPLELKTGRPSFSLEHRGQVILYTMMMAVTGQDVEAGLLLYLRENIMREIKVGHPERRDLILLRNNLAYYLTRVPKVPRQEDSGLELPSQTEWMELPEPINHRACQTCPYSALCAAYLKNDVNYQLTDRHPLTPILKNLDNYLKPEHIEYVKRWVKMLQIEESDQVNVQSVRYIWTVPPQQREKKGKCISNLKIIGEVVEESNRFLHTFARGNVDNLEAMDDLTNSGFAAMEYVIVSTDTKVNVCAGPIIELSKDFIILLLDRNLREKRPNDVFHIDGYTSQSILIINLSNVGYLLDDNTVTEKLRKIVIERQPATFLPQLARSMAAAAAKILKPLNKTQQRAVLKVFAANEYLLIKGMPGSGKTRTLVAIIELLVKMGKSVLLTAHTHSAVDNVLLKLIKTDVDFVRLGSTTKIHPLLMSKSESVLTENCYSPEGLEAAYNSKNVVCVTCLGANHSLLTKRMFDVCLVDESTQVLQSSILRPLYSASKFVLLGDPDQLPPVVKSNAARELGMDQSLFERLDSNNNTIILTSQYRMNHRIMAIANQVTYKGRLTIGTDSIGNATLDIPDKLVLNSSQRWVRAALSSDLDDSVVILDTGDKYTILKNDTSSENNDYHVERKYSNLCEVAVILHLVTTLIEAGLVAERIGVIAPYREQVTLLRDVIKQDVEVNTVDQYQGRDKDIILYSGTRSGSVKSNVDKEFNILDDHRRLTVAVTRAKHKLIVVGDVNSLRQFVPFKKLLDQMRSKDVIVLKNGSADFAWEKLISTVKQ